MSSRRDEDGEHGDFSAFSPWPTKWQASSPLIRRDLRLRSLKRCGKSKRELVDTGTDKWYVRRDEDGKSQEPVNVGRSVSAHKRHNAEHETKQGEGDKGDHKR